MMTRPQVLKTGAFILAAVHVGLALLVALLVVLNGGTAESLVALL